MTCNNTNNNLHVEICTLSLENHSSVTYCSSFSKNTCHLLGGHLLGPCRFDFVKGVSPECMHCILLGV